MERRGDTEVEPGRRVPSTVDRVATGAFLAYLAVAFFVCVFWLGRDDWFSGGDWKLLAGPTLPDVNAPIEQHWSAVPVLLYQAYLRLFGVDYTPFLVTVVALHLLTALLLWELMRRCGVRPWVASIVASVLVLFGPGFVSILMPIQITQNLSLVLALSQLLLADHDDGLDWRDGLALAAGAVGLASSGLMPVLVFGVGLTLLVRRGWRSAALQTVPLAALYLWWFRRYDPASENGFYQAPAYSLGTNLSFVRDGLTGTLQSVGGWAAVGVLMVLLVVAGTVICVVQEGVRPATVRLAAPLSLALCSVLYLAVVGYQRSVIRDYASFSHHLYTVAALWLPLLACAIDALVRRWAILAPIVAVLLLTAVVVNLRFPGEERPPGLRTRYLATKREQFSTEAHSPTLHQRATTDGSTPVFPVRSYFDVYAPPSVTLSWLREQSDAGRVG